MKLLAKSIIDKRQTDTRKDLDVDGIEIVLLGRELDDENINATTQAFIALADHFPIIGVEAPISYHGLPVNPIAEDTSIREQSREYLQRCLDLTSQLKAATGAEVYFQYQYAFGNFQPNGYPARKVPRDYELQQIAAFHRSLEAQCDFPVQIENGTPIHLHNNQPAYRHTTIRLSDFAEHNIPVALDICHLAISLYTWSKARPLTLNLDSVKTPRGILAIEMTEEDRTFGRRIADSRKDQNSITDILIEQITQYAPIIGSLQFSNAKAGFATSDEEEGYAGSDGLIDIPRVLAKAIVPCNLPYLIPEYQEEDYCSPIHQRTIISFVRTLSKR